MPALSDNWNSVTVQRLHTASSLRVFQSEKTTNHRLERQGRFYLYHHIKKEISSSESQTMYKGSFLRTWPMKTSTCPQNTMLSRVLKMGKSGQVLRRLRVHRFGPQHYNHLGFPETEISREQASHGTGSDLLDMCSSHFPSEESQGLPWITCSSLKY